MFDVRNYMRITDWLDTKPSKDAVLRVLGGSGQSSVPYVYNVETTNACPMRCKMCPRTTMMKRPVSTMPMATFRKVADQIRPHTDATWRKWTDWAGDRFGVLPTDPPSENHFFLYVIPRVLQLHGYGEPLVDKRMPERIGYLTERGIESYFSCNPAVLDETRFVEHMRAGLSWVKFSIESTDDERFKSIRGARANFTESYAMIKALLAERDRKGYQTRFVITMLDLGAPDSAAEFARLKDKFKDLPTYCYHKSEDTQWLREDGGHGTKSIHWSRPCLHPWCSTTVLADGTVAGCMEAFDDCEFDLGNVNEQPLADIWNGPKYAALRHAHLTGEGLPSKCVSRCDMPTVGGLRG